MKCMSYNFFLECSSKLFSENYSNLNIIKAFQWVFHQECVGERKTMSSLNK